MSDKTISQNRAIFTGTFDPPTLGHLDIIKRAAPLFDKLYVAVYSTSLKRQGLSLEDKIHFLTKMVSEVQNVEVISFSGLAVDLCKKNGADFIVRGIRNHTDLDFESQMATTNKHLTQIETIFFLAAPSYAHLSSTLIRQIAACGHRLKGLVPDSIEEDVFQKLKS